MKPTKADAEAFDEWYRHGGDLGTLQNAFLAGILHERERLAGIFQEAFPNGALAAKIRSGE